VLAELLPPLTALCREARDAALAVTIDAEEAERLDLTLDILDALGMAEGLAGWDGLGLAVQAYQKRAVPLIAWLADLARVQRRLIPVRLVKGAYWDSEIKRAQEQGLADYPVFTRKAATDTSYLACARALLAAPGLYPQFATHNAHTLAAIEIFAGGHKRFEFQRLHGMGEALYALHGARANAAPLRVYAPVGSHEDVLAYLVRRLLENGANASFVNRLADAERPVATVTADPVARLASLSPKRNPRIPKPDALFPGRRNSAGLFLGDPAVRERLLAGMHAALDAGPHSAHPVVSGALRVRPAKPSRDPADRRRIVGEAGEATDEDVRAALDAAAAAQTAWDGRRGPARAAILETAADLYEENRDLLTALLVREAGRTVPDALGEVREAVDFLRYYATSACNDFEGPVALPGPSGEGNETSLHGRGVFACIAPWNFPVSIFTGQIAGALAAGNSVLAKPAEQTPLIAAAAVRLLHAAGVPGEVLHFLPGDGARIGARMFADPRLAGVAFTGSTETAILINRALAARSGPLPALIAETGGLNAMIVDSTALPEQVARDCIASAFDSAGQRCSSLRVLFLQEDVAEPMLERLLGAMDTLTLGDPFAPETDIGPVIDEEARAALHAHAARMRTEARLLKALPCPGGLDHGVFFPPHVFEISAMDVLSREVFGPILHVVRFAGGRLDAVCEAINRSGYGLTLGLHSRIDATAAFVRERVRVGNLYVNRNQIGAVVEAQPFGGEGLSGTGPKAGGPSYVRRFALERSFTRNDTATGGNPGLLTLDEG
jgi:RHH-type proline utilization regulon transcriptional repressor/proline dehydrogenase/delta 1-pyrroline-5-carboxylate dehydrogenase